MRLPFNTALHTAHDFTLRLERHIKLISIIISLIFVGSLLIVASIYRDPIPYLDYLDWIDQVYSGHWPSVLWEPHNQHRLVLVRLIVYCDSVLLHGAIWPVVVLAECLLLGIAILLLRQVFREVSDPTKRWAIVAALSVCMFRAFSIRIVREPMNINFLLVNFFFVVGLALIFSASRRHKILVLIGACACAMADTVSAANGLVAWPVYAIAFQQLYRWTVGTSILLCLGAGVTIAYLIGLSPPNPQMNPWMALSQPLQILQFMAHYIGAPWRFGPLDLANGTGVGAAITAVVVIRSLYRLIRGRILPSSIENFSLAIVLFIMGTGFLTALGRLNLGLFEARSVRYFIGTEMMQFAVLTLLTGWLVEAFPKSPLLRIAGTALVAAGLLMLPEQLREIVRARDDYRTLLQAQARLATNPDDASALNAIYPDVDAAHRIVLLMSDHRIYGFGGGGKGP